MPNNYDSKCYDLACSFLEDEPAINNEENRDTIASDIQTAIEDAIAYIKTPRCVHGLKSGNCDKCVQDA